MSFLTELRRRNVFKVGAAYVVLAWLLAQGVDVFLANFGAPEWVIKTTLFFLVAGFPLALFFAWAYELTPEGLKKEKDVERSQSITQKTGRKLDYAIFGILVFALGYFIWESRFESKDVIPATNSTVIPATNSTVIPAKAGTSVSPSEPQTESNTEVVATINPKSIAVLPFVNMSEDANNEYFSDGISEEILNALAQVKELKVAGRTSSFAFKDQNQDLRQIGETLGVANILEGSVRKAGTKVRITAQLIQVEDGFHLWSSTYDRELTDVFAIQDEIAAAILQQLKAHLLDDQLVNVEATRTNSESYDLYLLARQRIYERKQLSLEMAAEMLDKAIALDPGYAPAYAQRAVTDILLTDKNYGTIPAEEGFAAADSNIKKALELDPALAEGWAALGLYHLQRPGENDLAIETLEKARSINPSLIDTSNWLQNAYAQAGRMDESGRILESMLERDPLYPPAVGNGVAALADLGQLEQAQAVLDRAKPFLASDPLILNGEAMLHFYRGEFAVSLPRIEMAIAEQPGNSSYRFNLSVGLLQTHQYERVTEEGFPFFQVIALAQLGRVEEAGILAQQLAAQGDVGTLLTFLNASGQYQELVRFVEERWPDLDQFQVDYPGGGLNGYPEMVNIAYAYSQTGNQQRFDDAMRRIRRAHDQQKSFGADNYIFQIHEASYYALAGDREQAIDFFERAIDQGHIASTRPSERWPALKSLEGDPRFEAARLRMMEHLNRERAALGLEPVEA